MNHCSRGFGILVPEMKLCPSKEEKRFWDFFSQNKEC